MCSNVDLANSSQLLFLDDFGSNLEEIAGKRITIWTQSPLGFRSIGKNTDRKKTHCTG